VPLGRRVPRVPVAAPNDYARPVRTYLTGGEGFVGGFLAAHLRACGEEVTLSGRSVDVTDGPAVGEDMKAAAPAVVYHLAALTHVGASWEDPAETMRVNAIGTLLVLEAAGRCDPAPTVVLVSSAEVYGRGDGSQVGEGAPLRPISPYAASKVAAEFAGLQAHLGRGLRVVRARPFNHVGAGQSDAFVVSALARRIAAAELAGGGEVRVGNLSSRRDFTDVRDVVRAYRLLAAAGEPGEVYNVCSGEAVEIADVARKLCALVDVDVQLVTDPALYRPADVPVLRGDNARICELTGWKPEISLDDTLVEVLAWWRAELRREPC
jgi:GDP-4-dehydro-6-deoxy-D-mannose reductase